MSFMKEWQHEEDRPLMNFKSYEEYLDSLVAMNDMFYLRGAEPRILAELGYRSTGETLNRKQFERRRQAVSESLYPTHNMYTQDNEGIVISDPLMRELALRERANRLGVLATILHLHLLTPMGYELSGYIDFADRLEHENWIPYFQGRRKIHPRPTDLAYYHWRIDKSKTNSNSNFKVVHDTKKGLMFKHWTDRLQVNVDPTAPSSSAPGQNTTRVRINTPKYLSAILYDHVVRQKC